MSFRKTRDIPLRDLQADLQQAYNTIDFSANFKTAYQGYVSSSVNIIDKYAPIVKHIVTTHCRPKWMDDEFVVGKTLPA